MKTNLCNYIILGSLLFPLTSQYKEYNIEDDDLCSPILKKRTVRLDRTSRSGLIVRQSRLNDHVLPWSLNFKCKFQLDASSDKQGIIAVIQHLVFRKNSTTNECIDYVQFTRKDRSQSQKFCGRFNAALHMDRTFVGHKEKITANSFVDSRGEMDTTIFVSRESLRQDEEMDLNIVYTAYTKCDSKSQREMSTAPCSSLNDFCIYKDFFSDTYFNCPEPDCQDEYGCSDHAEKDPDKLPQPSIGNQVLIGSLSVLTIIFALFIISLWVFRTYKLFCWSEHFSNPSHNSSNTTQPEQTRVIELSDRSPPLQPVSQLTTASPSTEEDKDLPPSYDSLFPTRRSECENKPETDNFEKDCSLEYVL